jgi:hypothetical protein
MPSHRCFRPQLDAGNEGNAVGRVVSYRLPALGGASRLARYL